MPKKPIPIDIEEEETPVAGSDGLMVKRRTTRRGHLCNMTEEIVGQLRPSDGDLAVASLNHIKSTAQEILAAAGLPIESSRHGSLAAHIRLWKLAEPLSAEEIAAELIDKINAVLAFEDKRFAMAALKLVGCVTVS
jgi:hypothetical protein